MYQINYNTNRTLQHNAHNVGSSNILTHDASMYSRCSLCTSYHLMRSHDEPKDKLRRSPVMKKRVNYKITLKFII